MSKPAMSNSLHVHRVTPASPSDMLMSISYGKTVIHNGSASHSVCQYFKERVIIYFHINTAFYVVTNPTVYFGLYILIPYMMLLKVKDQFNSCLCMQARLKHRVLFKYMQKD